MSGVSGFKKAEFLVVLLVGSTCQLSLCSLRACSRCVSKVSSGPRIYLLCWTLALWVSESSPEKFRGLRL